MDPHLDAFAGKLQELLDQKLAQRRERIVAKAIQWIASGQMTPKAAYMLWMELAAGEDLKRSLKQAEARNK